MAAAIDTEEFIRRARAVHADRYDYRQTQYKNNLTPVAIECAVHGVFMQRPNHHMNGSGCPACKAALNSSRCKGDAETFIAKARECHGDRYDYSRVRYVNAATKVEILCQVHGVFMQSPNSHVSRGAGCPKCAGKSLTTADFVEKARDVHGDLFAYQNTHYRRIKEDVIITCAKHGDFEQTAENHLAGNGCRFCWSEATASRAEAELAAWCASLGLRVMRNDRTALERMEIDIFIPDQRIGIEFNGCYWHSHKVQKNSRQHEFKQEAARRAGIRLITVWDFDWQHQRAIVQRHLLNALHLSPSSRLHARSCTVAQISPSEANALYADHHLQGACRGAVAAFGLMHDGELVAAMSFTQGGHRRGIVAPDEFELARYATSSTVRGGASRLFAAFVASFSPRLVWSFSDDQHFDGGLYPLLGFERNGHLPADYRLVDPRSLRTWHKSLWQRKSIPRRLAEFGHADAFDPAADPRTESQMHDVAKVLRVYDAGKTRWVWRQRNN